MKKKHILILSFVLFVNLMSAQIDKGNWMVGGSGNFTNYKSTFQSNNTEFTQTGSGISISPNLGYFVVDNFAVGTAVGFNFSNPSGANNNSHSYGISPFVRYYFRKAEKIINPFLQTSYGFSEGKSESGGSNKSRGYTIKGGSAIFFNSSVALELSLNYNSSKYNSDTTYNDLTIGIGFQIHLEKK
ncbi:outer membrane beta-barrel protein [Flavobacterium segetis]|nr:outer membrane beta-barrel protein [Flavobacterium segetis]